MDYEKAYKEACEKAKGIINYYKECNRDEAAIEDLEQIFPELKESEDERIRKWLICGMNALKEKKNETFATIPIDDAIAWLEKQGENANFQNKIQVDNQVTRNYDNVPANLSQLKQAAEYVDEVKPEFHEGDWVVTDKNDRVQIKAVNNSYYTIDNGMYFNIPYVDKYWHLWTIQDAKKGDVLEFEDHKRVVVGIVSFVNERTGKVDVSCLLEDNEFKIGNFYALDTIKPHPATKEQRDTLFAKMKEAGYTFDFDKKKIEDEIEIPFGAKDSELQEATYYIPKGFHAEIDDDKVVIKKGEKSAAWSEEDEKMYKIAFSCIETLEDISNGKNMHADVKDWLKSLKNRIGG